ncbi:MAG: hypothetical protein F4160_18750 [Rhodospirillaceae bacterium]|nr:hypothetical protein [Rhodospirillaceae bacterium]
MADALCHDPAHTPRWGMVIDVNRCVGCQTCTIACKHWNDTLPDIQWRRVIDVEQGEYPNVQRQFLVTGCQHCAEPPCVPVCPTGATRQREDGLVTMDYDVCIGCAYCAVACPYQARTIAHEIHGYYDGEITRQEEAVFDEGRIGVAQKCTFCIDRVDSGLEAGLTPGLDPDATPACSAACIASAITFGDYNDPDSNVSQLVRDNPAFQMHEELGTDPQIKYLYTTPAVPGREPEAADLADERLADPANPLVGTLQPFWDWRAAMNWMFGGVGSGFVFAAWLASFVVPAEAAADYALWLSAAQFAGAGLMAIGLFFVFLKIGRKLRFWRAVSRPQTSWMTRELYIVAVFGIAVLLGIATQHPGAQAVAALAALGFLGCQAMILYRARGIPAWRHRLMPWMIVTTGLLEGFALLMPAFALSIGLLAAFRLLVPLEIFVYSALALKTMQSAGVVVIVLAVASLILWTAYLRSAAAGGIGPLARAVLAKVHRRVLILGTGLPALLYLVGLIALGAGQTGTRIAIGVWLAGSILAIFGGVYWKFMIVARAGYQQGFAMPKQPHRGSGVRAAPPRLDGTVMRPGAPLAESPEGVG